MIKFIKTFFVLSVFALYANANEQISDKLIKEIESLNLFKGAQIKILRGFDNGDIYLLNVNVRGQNTKIYLTKDKKYLVAGDVVNTDSGRAVEIPDMPVDMKVTLGKEAFIFGKGKDEYVLFTDPECPYCKKFESYFSQIEDKVKIRVFFYPLPSHANAKDISIFIMSQNGYENRVKAMTTTNANSPEFLNRKIDDKKLDELTKSLESQMEVANKLGVRGTPSVFDTKGNKVSWVEMLQKYGIVVK